jgi:hypothetical protein
VIGMSGAGGSAEYGDDALLAELGAAVRAGEQVPASFLAAGRAAFAWRTVDAELATLAMDSATAGVDALPGTRADRASLRALTFVAAGLTLELELTEDALFGQVVPPQPARVELQERNGATRCVEVDDVGWFDFRPAPSGMFRLRVQTAASVTSIVTEWITAAA